MGDRPSHSRLGRNSTIEASKYMASRWWQAKRSGHSGRPQCIYIVCACALRQTLHCSKKKKWILAVLPGVSLVCGESANADVLASLGICEFLVDWVFGFWADPFVLVNGMHRRRLGGRWLIDSQSKLRFSVAHAILPTGYYRLRTVIAFLGGDLQLFAAYNFFHNVTRRVFDLLLIARGCCENVHTAPQYANDGTQIDKLS